MTSSSNNNNTCSTCHLSLDDVEHSSNNNNNNEYNTTATTINNIFNSFQPQPPPPIDDSTKKLLDLFTNTTNNITNPNHSNYNPNWRSLRNNVQNTFWTLNILPNIYQGTCKSCSQPIYHFVERFIIRSFCNSKCIELYEKKQKQIKIEKKLKQIKKLHKDGINNTNIVGTKRTEKLAIKTYKKILRPRKF
jgi:hypothetical protein